MSGGDDSREMPRSLSELWRGEDVVEISTTGAACLLKTQENATIVVEKFLDLRISKVSINYDGLNTFERPGGLEGGGFIKINHRDLVYDC